MSLINNSDMDQIFKTGMALRLKNIFSINIKPPENKMYCRLCLTPIISYNCRKLFGPFNTNRTVAEVVLDFAEIHILPDDEYSKLICLGCLGKLVQMTDFKASIEAADFKLRGKEEKVEEELMDIDDNCDERGIGGVDETDLPTIESTEKTNLNQEIDNCNQAIDNETKIEIEESDLKQLINEEKTEQTANCLSLENDDNSDHNQYSDDDEEENVDNVKLTKPKQKKLFSCPHCDKKYVSHECLKAHICTHTGKYPFHCSFCHRPFGTRGRLLSHEPIHTNSSERVQCEICGKFMTASRIKNHLQDVHQDKKEFKCTVCNKIFKSRSSWKDHGCDHSEEFPYRCIVCEETFTIRRRYLLHCRIRHVPYIIFPCEFCGKLTSDYANHKKIHTKTFKCVVCFHTFINKTELNYHMNFHTKDKLYQCEQCELHFITRRKLRQHEVKKHSKKTREYRNRVLPETTEEVTS